MSQTLYVMVGPSGSGKTTWSRETQKQLEKEGHSVWVAHRDTRRLALIADTLYLQEYSEEEYQNMYFSREKEVFVGFVREIQGAIDDGDEYIIADATHLNRASRNKLLSRLNVYNRDVELHFIVMPTDLDACIQINESRIKIFKVPNKVVEEQFRSFTIPNEKEFPNDKWGFSKIEVEEATWERYS